MTGQDIINSTSQDVRQVIQASGSGQTILLDYVDRVQKDCLHSGVFAFLNRATTTVTLVSGTSSYTLTPTTIRSIAFVYDRTLQIPLNPLPDMVPAVPDPIGLQTLMKAASAGGSPSFYRLVGQQNLVVFPTPLAADTLEIHYTNQVTTLASATTTLTIPDDGKDMVVAGTNMLAQFYLGRIQEAQAWMQLYQQLKGAPTTLVALKPETV